MLSRLTTDEDQPTTFVELFFDLVFVFAVTQVVGVIYEHQSWGDVARGLVIFWLVWWAWTQFTWAMNSADTTNDSIEATMLFATSVAFAMAVAIPSGFTSEGVWFAIAYVTVRVIGLAVYGRVAYEHPAKREPLRLFVILSIPGFVTVLIGGFIDGDGRMWWWAVAVGLDVISAVASGNAEGWDIRLEHFGERHGLFVIIALGESLIVAAGGLANPGRTNETLLVGLFALVITCSQWWAYFTAVKPALEHAVRRQAPQMRTAVVRDVYSIIHFPILFGVVLLAVAIKAAVTSPSIPLSSAAELSLAGGLALFMGGAVTALLRAGQAVGLLAPSLLAILSVAVLVQQFDAVWSLLMAGVGSNAVAVALWSRLKSHQIIATNSIE